MIRAAISAVRSLAKLCWTILRGLTLSLVAILRCDFASAGGYMRALAIYLHDDVLQGIVALQGIRQRRLTPSQVKKILIVKLDRIGDMVTTTPVFDALRDLFPNARLDIVGHPVPLQLLDGDERIGDRIPYRSWLYHPLPILPGGPRAWWLIIKLLARRYPLVVYLRGSSPFLWLGLTSRFAAIKFVKAEPVIRRYMKALERLFGPLPEPLPRLSVNEDTKRFAQQLLNGHNGYSSPTVVIHASASSATKVWPPERFAALADELNATDGVRVHFLGGPADELLLERIADLSARKHRYHSSLRLPNVVAVIAGSDLFIGNDSGLSHIAAAVGTPSVVLWGPANLSMARPKAPPDRLTILYHDLPCRDACPEFKCTNPNQYECLMRTETADVLDAARRLLHAECHGKDPRSPDARSGGTSNLVQATSPREFADTSQVTSAALPDCS
jgi:ADP-heptose:LPS heptosyltransferase